MQSTPLLMAFGEGKRSATIAISAVRLLKACLKTLDWLEKTISKISDNVIFSFLIRECACTVRKEQGSCEKFIKYVLDLSTGTEILQENNFSVFPGST